MHHRPCGPDGAAGVSECRSSCSWALISAIRSRAIAIGAANSIRNAEVLPLSEGHVDVGRDRRRSALHQSDISRASRVPPSRVLESVQGAGNQEDDRAVDVRETEEQRHPDLQVRQSPIY